MSSRIAPLSPSVNPCDDFWGRLFGRFIRSARENAGRSVGEAAGLAGMGPAEWKAVEAGQVPATLQQLEAIAGALNIERTAMADLVLLCSRAWDF
jgi:transcriptional regulator with XRE-family HTH domain